MYALLEHTRVPIIDVVESWYRQRCWQGESCPWQGVALQWETPPHRRSSLNADMNVRKHCSESSTIFDSYYDLGVELPPPPIALAPAYR